MMWEELVKQVGNRMRLDRRVFAFLTDGKSLDGG